MNKNQSMSRVSPLNDLTPSFGGVTNERTNLEEVLGVSGPASPETSTADLYIECPQDPECATFWVNLSSS